MVGSEDADARAHELDLGVARTATLSAGGSANTLSAPVSDAGLRARGGLVGRYVVLALLGTGGMGAVYAAYDPELDRKVALKLLRPDAATLDSVRLTREARALAKLSHPNVVSVFDVGTVGAEVFIAMEFIEGMTVSRWMQQRTRSVREVLDCSPPPAAAWPRRTRRT